MIQKAIKFKWAMSIINKKTLRRMMRMDFNMFPVLTVTLRKRLTMK